MSTTDAIPLGHGIKIDPDNGRYKFAMKGLTRGEALELLCVVRRLELYRTAHIDTDIVEHAMRTMADMGLRQ